MTRMDNIKTTTYRLDPKMIKAFILKVKKKDKTIDLHNFFTDDCFYVDIVDEENRFTSWIYTTDSSYDDKKMFVNYVDKSDFESEDERYTEEKFINLVEDALFGDTMLLGDFCEQVTNAKVCAALKR